MNCTITTTLPLNLYNFVKQQSKTRKTTYKQILKEAVENYKKQKMAEEIKQGLLSRQDEIQQINSEFHDLQSFSITE